MNHVAGDVAPVTKTTTYALASNIAGLPSFEVVEDPHSINPQIFAIIAAHLTKLKLRLSIENSIVLTPKSGRID